MQSIGWERPVLLFYIVCHGVLLWRLWREQLAGVYLFLTVFLGAEMLQSIVLLPISRETNLYALLFEFTTAAMWILAYLVVLELYRLTLEDYPGIASVGRKAVTWSMGLAVVVSVFYAIPDLRTAGGPEPIIVKVFPVLERSTVLGLLLFLVLIQMFLFHYKLPLSRNRMIYATGYAVYFGISMALDIVWTGLGIQIADSVSLWIVAGAGVTLLAGAVLLSQRGEAKAKLDPVDADSDRLRLQQQLSEMNRMLTRAARGRG
jgi:hypothetical protein